MLCRIRSFALLEISCMCTMPTDTLYPAVDRTDKDLLTSFCCAPCPTCNCLWNRTPKAQVQTPVSHSTTASPQECFTGLNSLAVLRGERDFTSCQPPAKRWHVGLRLQGVQRTWLLHLTPELPRQLVQVAKPRPTPAPGQMSVGHSEGSTASTHFF